ncbi:protein tyrosine phosphatase receptor type C-associated protein [Python bivittatus]|uniref:Protein tyrosine phosphatase receptor type C-associated protein n=1 Tax=Python bivittatus TaxID=176946 RepID=A0A9F2KUW6_PYTBI|nr:protein tyrosine phosphatase receptor type C-associated protein [Python bivittatus]
MMKLRLSHILLLVLPGKVQAGTPGNDRRYNENVTVSILICLLLVLLLLLFMAWHWLNRATEGRYHPQHLMRILILQWQQFWRETPSEDLAQDCQDEKQSDGELGEEQQQLMEDGEGEGEEEEEEEEEMEEEEEEQQLLQEQEEKPTKGANPEAAAQEALEEDEASKAAEGSAEVLLSHLHSFSGTAAWEDSGKPLNVTAL